MSVVPQAYVSLASVPRAYMMLQHELVFRACL